MLADTDTSWTELVGAQWYGAGHCEVEVCTDTAVLYHLGKPSVLIRWLRMRDPHGVFKPQAVLSTHPDHTPEQRLT